MTHSVGSTILGRHQISRLHPIGSKVPDRYPVGSRFMVGGQSIADSLVGGQSVADSMVGGQSVANFLVCTQTIAISLVGTYSIAKYLVSIRIVCRHLAAIPHDRQVHNRHLNDLILVSFHLLSSESTSHQVGIQSDRYSISTKSESAQWASSRRAVVVLPIRMRGLDESVEGDWERL